LFCGADLLKRYKLTDGLDWSGIPLAEQSTVNTLTSETDILEPKGGLMTGNCVKSI
jgi:hypothetical protein